MRTTSRRKLAQRHRRRSADGMAARSQALADEEEDGGALHRGGPHEPSDDDAPAPVAGPDADVLDGLGVSPHEMDGAEADAAPATIPVAAVTPRERGRPRKRPASATPAKGTPPGKRMRQPRARAATMGDSPHVSRRRKPRSLSWVNEVSGGSSDVATGFTRATSVGAAPSEGSTVRVVVPGVSIAGSPVVTSSTWPPKGEAKSPLQRPSIVAKPHYMSALALGGAGPDGDASASRLVGDGEGVLSASNTVVGRASDAEEEGVEEAQTTPLDGSIDAEQSADGATADDAAAATTEAAADLSDKSTGQPPMDAQSVIMSPVQDEKKVTPRKGSASKKRRSLDATFAAAKTTEFSVDEVAQLIAELYQEQEQDDRGMYSITTETVREQTAQCERSEEVEELSLEDFRRLLTYGEVSVESVSSTILPFLSLTEDDVLYDLGCGTGKILVQAVLQTTCAKAVGIELMQNRVQEGLRALDRLDSLELELLKTKNVTLVQGDICKPPPSADMSDATVVFINNVMFGPKLMMKVMQQLESIPKLKRIVTLRKVCERHRQTCQRAGNLCASYVDPPETADIFVSWASKTQVYMYERVDYSLMKLSSTLQAPLVANDAFLAAMVAEAEAEQPAAAAKTRAARKKTAEASKSTTPTKAARTPTKAARAPTKTPTKRVRRR